MNDASLHACTPARCALALTLLGHAPAATLLDTLAALTLCALALVSSLFEEGISRLLAPGSEIVDLTSPNATRQTARPAPACCARRRSLVASSLMHNWNELLAHKPGHSQPCRPASQAASRPINENAPCLNGLTDGFTLSSGPRIWLSGAVNGIPSSLLLLLPSGIHNCRLSINLALLTQETDENRKMDTSIFSVFILKKKEPYREWFVKGKRSGLDKPFTIWHVAHHSGPHGRPCSHAARRPQAGAGVVTRTCLDTVAVLSMLPESEVCR